MIAITNERKSEEGITNADFAVTGIHDLDPTVRQYGVVLGLSTLQLIEDIDAVNASIFAMLRPGSYFISSRVCMTPRTPDACCCPCSRDWVSSRVQVASASSKLQDMLRGTDFDGRGGVPPGEQRHRAFPGDSEAGLSACRKKEGARPDGQAGEYRLLSPAPWRC